MMPFERDVRVSSKDHAVAAFMSITMTNPATALHHYAGRNSASAEGDLLKMTQANRRFHFVIVEAAEMPRLERMIGILWDATDAYRFVYYGSESNRSRVEHEHHLIIAAFAERDTEKLVSLLDEHREHAVKALRAFLEVGSSRTVHTIR